MECRIVRMEVMCNVYVSLWKLHVFQWLLFASITNSSMFSAIFERTSSMLSICCFMMFWKSKSCRWWFTTVNHHNLISPVRICIVYKLSDIFYWSFCTIMHDFKTVNKIFKPHKALTASPVGWGELHQISTDAQLFQYEAWTLSWKLM